MDQFTDFYLKDHEETQSDLTLMLTLGQISIAIIIIAMVCLVFFEIFDVKRDETEKKTLTFFSSSPRTNQPQKSS